MVRAVRRSLLGHFFSNAVPPLVPPWCRAAGRLGRELPRHAGRVAAHLILCYRRYKRCHVLNDVFRHRI